MQYIFLMGQNSVGFRGVTEPVLLQVPFSEWIFVINDSVYYESLSGARSLYLHHCCCLFGDPQLVCKNTPTQSPNPTPKYHYHRSSLSQILYLLQTEGCLPQVSSCDVVVLSYRKICADT